MPNVIDSTVENPELYLESFIKLLEQFIIQSAKNLQQVNVEHQNMSISWQGEQYEDFGKVLNNLTLDAKKELLELNALKESLQVKLKELKEAKGYKL